MIHGIVDSGHKGWRQRVFGACVGMLLGITVVVGSSSSIMFALDAVMLLSVLHCSNAGGTFGELLVKTTLPLLILHVVLDITKPQDNAMLLNINLATQPLILVWEYLATVHGGYDTINKGFDTIK